eukprot:7771215-Alexandrium_andersonii.AAC.1
MCIRDRRRPSCRSRRTRAPWTARSSPRRSTRSWRARPRSWSCGTSARCATSTFTRTWHPPTSSSAFATPSSAARASTRRAA